MRVGKGGKRRGAIFTKIAVGAVCLVAVAAGVVAVRPKPDAAKDPAAAKSTAPGKIRWTVKRDNLTISTLAGGDLKTKSSTQVTSQVERQVNLLWIIEEGAKVKAGDKLIELDHSDLDEQLLKQKIRMAEVNQLFHAASDDLAISESKATTDLVAAENLARIAQLDYTKYMEGDYEQERRKRESAVAIAEEELKRAKDKLDWTKKLADKGYVTQNDLEADQFAVTKSQIQVESARQDLQLLLKFVKERESTKLQTAVGETKAAMERVKLTGQRDLSTRRAALDAAKSTVELESLKLKDLEEQISRCVITAPKDGMVVYFKERWSENADLQIGSAVNPRQKLIDLPDFSAWRAEVRVHESQIQQIRIGQAAFVTLDAFPEKLMQGKVSRIAVLPDNTRWYRDTQEYIVDVELAERDTAFKPGMSSTAEIVLSEIPNALVIPVQAVHLREGKTMAWVAEERGTVEREVKVGQDNGRFVEVASGLTEGETVFMDEAQPQGTGLGSRPAERATADQRKAASEASKEASQNPAPAIEKKERRPKGEEKKSEGTQVGEAGKEKAKVEAKTEGAAGDADAAAKKPVASRSAEGDGAAKGAAGN